MMSVVTVTEVDQWSAELDRLHARIGGRFARLEPRRRVRDYLAGLIRRPPRSNRYMLTDDGIRIAILYTKTYNRLLVPLTAADQPQASPELRAALATITRHVDDYANHARLPHAASELDTNVKNLATRDR